MQELLLSSSTDLKSGRTPGLWEFDAITGAVATGPAGTTFSLKGKCRTHDGVIQKTCGWLAFSDRLFVLSARCTSGTRAEFQHSHTSDSRGQVCSLSRA